MEVRAGYAGADAVFDPIRRQNDCRMMTAPCERRIKVSFVLTET